MGVRMSMKSEIEKSPELKHYPLLKRYNNVDMTFIVMFTTARTGMVVWTNTKTHPLGEMTSHWVEDEFTELLPSDIIKLSNAESS